MAFSSSLCPYWSRSVGWCWCNAFFPSALRQQHNDVAGFNYAVVGMVYVVLLALVVVAAWKEHEAAKGTVDNEANELAELYWLAHATSYRKASSTASKGSPGPTRAW